MLRQRTSNNFKVNDLRALNVRELQTIITFWFIEYNEHNSPDGKAIISNIINKLRKVLNEKSTTWKSELAYITLDIKKQPHRISQFYSISNVNNIKF